MFAEILVKRQHERMWMKPHRNHLCSRAALELPQPSLPPSPLGLSLPKGVRVACGLQAEQRGLCGEPKSPAEAEGNTAPPTLSWDGVCTKNSRLTTVTQRHGERCHAHLEMSAPSFMIISIFLQFYCDHYSDYYLLL